MGRALMKIEPGDSLMFENWKGPYSEDQRSRAERRWKRRDIKNEGLKHNGCVSATRKTVNSCGNVPLLTDQNVHMVEDEIDEDYKIFLDTYVSDIDSASDKNVGGSDINPETGYHSGNDDDADPEYKKFMENLREEGNSYVHSCFVDNKLVQIRYEGEEKEEKKLHKKVKVNTRMSKDLTRNNETGNLGNTGSDSMRNQQSLETERGPCNKKTRQNVSSIPKNNCHTDVVDEDYQFFLNSCRINDDTVVYMHSDSMGQISRVRQKSQVADQALNTPGLQREIDGDYQLFLNSTRIVDGDLVYMPDKNTTKTSKVEDDSKSSDSDLILIEPNSIGENTPFISAKTYLSCLENENPTGDSWQFSAQNHSQFRRRLMEYLERPYDQQEFDLFLHEVHQQRQTERHLETRRGVVKAYHVKGVNKSYLQLYPDLEKAIAEFKEPHRLLFLLRGFTFWLQNLSHEGVFRPWLDKSCLEILRKM